MTVTTLIKLPLVFNFGGHHFFRTARLFKFGMQIDRGEYYYDRLHQGVFMVT